MGKGEVKTEQVEGMGGGNRREDIEHSRDDETHSDESGSDEGTRLTVADAKGILRDILTLCGRQPHKKQLAEATAKAKGDPREAMLSMVPKVVQVAEDALAKKHKPKQPSSVRRAASSAASKTSPTNGKEQERDASPRATNNLREGEPLLVGFLREAQFLVKLDSSGNIKRDMKALRALLSPP